MRGTFSFALWASSGSPGPKLIAGIPSEVNLATSVHACLGSTLVLVKSINFCILSSFLCGYADSATSLIVNSPKGEKNLFRLSTASSFVLSGENL